MLLEEARQILPESVLRASSWETSLSSGEVGISQDPRAVLAFQPKREDQGLTDLGERDSSAVPQDQVLPKPPSALLCFLAYRAAPSGHGPSSPSPSAFS